MSYVGVKYLKKILQPGMDIIFKKILLLLKSPPDPFFLTSFTLLRNSDGNF